MPNKCTKCGNSENYNFALNIGLCNPCIGERLEKLETEIQKLGDGIESMNNKWVKIRRRLEKRIAELEADFANYFEMAAKSYTACGNYQQRIGELEKVMREVCDLINNSKTVSKWKIFNWLDKVLEGN